MKEQGVWHRQHDVDRRAVSLPEPSTVRSVPYPAGSIMSAPRSRTSPARSRTAAPRDVNADVRMALEWLEKKSTDRDRANLARFGITAKKAYGVSMANIQVLAKRLGRSHALAARVVGHRLVRGAHAGRLRRRAGAGDVRADGSLVPRLRQLGHLRHRVLQALRSHAARLDEGGGVEPHARRVRQARRLRAAGSLALHDKTAGDGPFSTACGSSSTPRATSATSSRRASTGRLRRIGTRNAALRAAAIDVAREARRIVRCVGAMDRQGRVERAHARPATGVVRTTRVFDSSSKARCRRSVKSANSTSTQ